MNPLCFSRRLRMLAAVFLMSGWASAEGVFSSAVSGFLGAGPAEAGLSGTEIFTRDPDAPVASRRRVEIEVLVESASPGMDADVVSFSPEAARASETLAMTLQGVEGLDEPPPAVRR